MNLFSFRYEYVLFLLSSLCTTGRAIDLDVPASCFVMSSEGKVFFAGSAQSDAAQKTLVGGNRDGSKYFPIMSDTATINGVSGQKNPLYNTTISFLGLIEEHDIFGHISRYKPVAVHEQEPAAIYCVEHYDAAQNSEQEKTADIKEDSEKEASKKEKKDKTILTAARGIKDSAAMTTSGIIALYVTSSNPATIVAAVKSHTGSWGSRGSGIAIIEPQTEERALTSEEQKEVEARKKEEEKQEGQKDQEQKTVPQTKKVMVLKQMDTWETKAKSDAIVRAFPLDVSSDAVKVGGDLAALGSAVDIHWDGSLGRFYIALQPTAGAGITDGARSIVVGYLEALSEIDAAAAQKLSAKKKTQKNDDADNQMPRKRRVILHLWPLMPDAACADRTEGIVGARGAGVQLSAHKVRTMATSTFLHYLIVQGGVGSEKETKRTVYAMPLMSKSTEFSRINGELQKIQKELAEKKKAKETKGCTQLRAKIDELAQLRRALEPFHGVLANKHADPSATDRFSDDEPHRLIDRNFRTPAMIASDVPSAHDQEALVGGGQLHGDITDIVVRGDAVFVTVCAADAAQSGIFCSQALFDHVGKIKSWTQWQRAGTCASENKKFYAGLTFDAFSQTMSPVGQGKNITAFTRSAWSKGTENSLVHVLNRALEKEPAGALALYDFPAGTPGLSSLSLLVQLSSYSVTLAHTGSLGDNGIVPERGDFSAGYCVCDDGCVAQPLSPATRVLTMMGGDLASVGPLTCAAIIPYKNTGILCVGGVNGVAMLVDDTGKGFYNLHSFVQIPADLRWRHVASLPFVSKLISDSGFLYVLTDTTLTRINLSQLDLSAIGADQKNGAKNLLDSCNVHVADLATLAAAGNPGILMDCVISGNLALLGTNKGLVRIGNGKDIRKINAADKAGWTSLAIPEAVGAITRLIPLSVTGIAADVARFGGGMLYVLDVSLGCNKGHLVRFTISDTQCRAIDASSVQLIADRFSGDGYAPFVDFEGYKNQFFTDGFFRMVTCNRDGSQMPSIQTLYQSVRTGSRGLGKMLTSLPIDVSNAHDISCAVRCGATGAWLVGGDMGVYSNE